MSKEEDIGAGGLASVQQQDAQLEAQKRVLAQKAKAEREKLNAARKLRLEALKSEPDDVAGVPEGFKAAVSGGEAIAFGNPPATVATHTDDVLGLTFSAGFYVGSGATGSGKSVTSVALLHHLLKQGVPVGYLYLHEARAIAGPLTEAAGKDAYDNDVVNVQPVSAFLRTLINAKLEDYSVWTPYGLASWAQAAASGKFTVLVIDSVTLSMRSYASNELEGRSGEPTMEGGLQPSDIEFCIKLQEYAADRAIMLIGLVNDDLVPFADKLEGVTEGAFYVERAGQFSIRNREQRVRQSKKLSADSLTWSLRKFFRYSDDDATKIEDADFLPIPGYSEVPGLQLAPNPSVYVPPSLPKPSNQI